DETGARAEDRPALCVELFQRGNEAPGIHQLEERRALAARDDQTIDVPELLGLAHFDGLDATSRERLGVAVEVALQREDTALHLRARSHASTVSALRFGGNTGYHTWRTCPASRYHAIRLIKVVGPLPAATQSGDIHSKVGSFSARVSARSASLSSSNGRWFRS